MNKNAKLEEEQLFHTSNHNYNLVRIKRLHKNSIYTIEDYINESADKIYKAESAKTYYSVIKSILKYKYTGEPLETDKLLTKEHKIESMTFVKMSNCLNFCKKRVQSFLINVDDMISLGISSGTNMIIVAKTAYEIIIDKMKENNDFHMPYNYQNGGFNQNYYSITPIEIFKRILVEKKDSFTDNKILEFYVDYYDKKQQENEKVYRKQ